MKHGSCIINTARGELIDTMALYEAIQSGKLAGCALDVHECERVTLNMSINPIKSLESADKNCIQKALIIQKLAICSQEWTFTMVKSLLKWQKIFLFKMQG